MSDRAPKARWGMGLRREDGAEYVGMSPSQFDAAVKAGAIAVVARPEAQVTGAVHMSECMATLGEVT